MRLRAAVIGCGQIGSSGEGDPKIKGIYTHAAAYDALAETELVGVCDSDAERAASCAAAWNVEGAFTTTTELLKNAAPDIVSISTPDETHAPVLREVLAAPSVRAVLVEKPLALDLSEGRDLVRLAQAKGVILSVNYSRRYSRGIEKIESFIQSGGMGSIQSVVGFYTKGIFHNGTHWLDLCRWLVGEFSAVQCLNERGDLGRDARLDAWFLFRNGATGYLHSLDADAYSLFELDLLGSNGRVRIYDSGHRIEYSAVKESPYYSGYRTLQRSGEQEGEMENTVLYAVADLVDCLKQGRSPKCSGKDGLQALAVAHSIYQSARTGRRVELA